MRIGLDFDNTIISYDALFYKVAREQGVVPFETPVNKIAVRNTLRRIGREEVWTEIQGTVYGARIDEAVAYPGVIKFLRWARRSRHKVAIVSHKTKHPFLGPQYDLHSAARTWVDRHLCVNSSPLIPASQVFFELTKEEKLARIGDFGCDVFLDDLPEILQASEFPTNTRRILFDPEGHYTIAMLPGIPIVQSWDRFVQCLRS